MTELIYIVLILVILFFLRKIFNAFKFPKVSAIAVFTGGVKVGKSAVSLACALSNYKRARRGWKFSCFFTKFTNFFRKKENKKDLPEEPLFYSTIPVRYIKYVPLTREHLMREKRFRYKSVVFIDEASLVADSQLIKDKKINTELLLFFKLFGHETHGGLCVVNSHSLSDLHFALKRCTSQYFYIHHLSKYIPFFTISYMREERYAEDGTDLNIYNEDIEDSMKRCIMKTSIFKKYDSFCFSFLTDYLPVDNETDVKQLDKYDTLKADKVVSFRPEFYNLTIEDIIAKEIIRNKELNNEKENG